MPYGVGNWSSCSPRSTKMGGKKTKPSRTTPKKTNSTNRTPEGIRVICPFVQFVIYDIGYTNVFSEEVRS